MNNKSVVIDDKAIGAGYPCFLIAEVGTTANGDMDRAKKLVDIAKEANFDAVKFQTISPEGNLSDLATTFRYKDIHGNMIEENMYQMFKGLTFTQDEWQEIADYALEKDIIFFSTVDYLEGVDVLERCKVPLHKIGSWDVNYEPLIMEAAKTKKPLMVDLGPAALSDIVRLLDLHRAYGTGEVILMHDFHTDKHDQMNMRAIPYLQKTFGLPVGFSAAGRDIDLDIIAIALGGHVIEKRITISRSDSGHHHAISLEMEELKPWVESMRKAERCLGSYEVKPSDADLEDSKKYYRSVCTIRDIRKGENYSPKIIDGKRPGTGIPSRYLELYYNRKAIRDVPENTLLEWNDLGT